MKTKQYKITNYILNCIEKVMIHNVKNPIDGWLSVMMVLVFLTYLVW